MWGGYASCCGYVNTGGRYNPSTDSWTATSTFNAPDGRYAHTAIWTGNRMIVWGGLKLGSRFSTLAGDTTRLRTVGSQRASPTRRRAVPITRQSGLEIK